MVRDSPYLGAAMLTSFQPLPHSGAPVAVAARVLRAAVAICVLATAPLAAQDEDAQSVAPEKPFAAMSRMLLGKGDSVAALAREQVGLKYRYGAKQPGKAFDCSGLVQFVLSTFNVSVPRTAREQATYGTEVEKDPEALQPGDLLYFGRGKKVTHIGIYVGEGRYVHAANRRKGVIESKLPAPTSTRRKSFWRGVRRLLQLPDTSAVAPVVAADSAEYPVGTAADVPSEKQ